jgi:head-tail adaptor
MDAGKLDTRIGVYRLNQTVDGYGGFSDSPTLLTTLWANVTYLSGEMKTENGSRKQSQKIKLIFRNHALVSPNNYFEYYLQFSGGAYKYRIVNMFESTPDFYTTIEAVSFA